jgi:hypothetical protein
VRARAAIAHVLIISLSLGLRGSDAQNSMPPDRVIPPRRLTPLHCFKQWKFLQLVAAPLLGNSLALATFPAWTAGKRPASAMQQLHIPMQIDLQQLQLMVEAATSADEPGKTAQCKPYCWRGLVFRSGLQVVNTSSLQEESHLRLSLFVRADNLPPGGVCTVTYQLMMRHASSAATAAGRVGSVPGHPNYCGQQGMATFVSASQPEQSQGVSWELPLGGLASWAAV